MMRLVSLLSMAAASASEQCSAAQSAAGARLLQRRHSSSPFTSEHHAGCHKMITHCLSRSDADQAPLFYDANWSAWQLGFDMCCNSQYNEELCHELNLVMFNFPERAFGPGDLVKETPDPALKDFCLEAEGLMDAHFAKVSFETDALLQIPSLFQKGIASETIRGVLSRVGRSRGLKLLHKSDTASRARVIRRHIQECQAGPCWEQVFLLQNYFTEAAQPSMHSKCFRALAQVNMSDGSMKQVRDMKEGDLVRSREGWTVASTEISFSQNSYRDEYCEKSVGTWHGDIVKYTLSGERPPLYVSDDVQLFVVSNGSIVKKDSHRGSDGVTVGSELVTLYENGTVGGGTFIVQREILDADSSLDLVDDSFCGPEVSSKNGFFVNGINLYCVDGSVQSLLAAPLLLLVLMYPLLL
ncbi:unnamed protein product [Symbiodinium sp. CCMP2592]|nr:unnamed protein product [Symbiodinium sp. CCMP2592]